MRFFERFSWKIAALALLGGTAAPALGRAAAAGSAGDLGAGVEVGDPTGVTAKKWISNVAALDAALAWDLSGSDDRLEFHADYLRHYDLSSAGLEGRLSFYAGVGGRLLTGHDARVGVRVPLGLSYIFPRTPVELFAEVSPLVDLTPSTDAGVNGGLGARFYFK